MSWFVTNIAPDRLSAHARVWVWALYLLGAGCHLMPSSLEHRPLEHYEGFNEAEETGTAEHGLRLHKLIFEAATEFPEALSRDFSLMNAKTQDAVVGIDRLLGLENDQVQSGFLLSDGKNADHTKFIAIFGTDMHGTVVEARALVSQEEKYPLYSYDYYHLDIEQKRWNHKDEFLSYTNVGRGEHEPMVQSFLMETIKDQREKIFGSLDMKLFGYYYLDTDLDGNAIKNPSFKSTPYLSIRAHQERNLLQNFSSEEISLKNIAYIGKERVLDTTKRKTLISAEQAKNLEGAIDRAVVNPRSMLRN